MKISIFTTALILIACIANAGNIDGKWEGFFHRAPDPDFKGTFTFKSDGKKLTGTTSVVSTGSKNKVGPFDIQNGKIEGNKISFEVLMKNQAFTMTIFYTGELSGDDLKLSFKRRKLEGNPDANIEFNYKKGGPPQTFVCKRVKNGE